MRLFFCQSRKLLIVFENNSPPTIIELSTIIAIRTATQKLVKDSNSNCRANMIAATNHKAMAIHRAHECPLYNMNKRAELKMKRTIPGISNPPSKKIKS